MDARQLQSIYEGARYQGKTHDEATQVVKAIDPAYSPLKLNETQEWADIIAATQSDMDIKNCIKVVVEQKHIFFNPHLDEYYTYKDKLYEVQTFNSVCQCILTDLYLVCKQVVGTYNALLHRYRDAARITGGRNEVSDQPDAFHCYREIKDVLKQLQVFPTSPTPKNVTILEKAIKATLAYPEYEMTSPNSIEDKISAKNGVINLRTGELEEYDPTHVWTRALPLDYIADAPAPAHWLKLIDYIANGNETHVLFLQRWLGHCLSGQLSKTFLDIIGETDTGKSKLIEILLEVFGPYASTVRSSLVVKSKNDNAREAQHDTIAAIQSRLAVVSEIQDNVVWNESVLKSLTGDKYLAIRKHHAGSEKVSNNSHILIVQNVQEASYTSDGAFLKRFLRYDIAQETPLGELINKEELDFSHIRKNELEGILRWLVAGCVAWFTKEEFESDVEAMARQATKDNCADVLAHHTDAFFVPDAREKMTLKTISRYFNEDTTSYRLSRVLTKMRFKKSKSGAARYYHCRFRRFEEIYALWLQDADTFETPALAFEDFWRWCGDVYGGYAVDMLMEKKEKNLDSNMFPTIKGNAEQKFTALYVGGVQ